MSDYERVKQEVLDAYYAEFQATNRNGELSVPYIRVGFDMQRDGWSETLQLAHAKVLYQRLGEAIAAAERLMGKRRWEDQ